MNGIPRRWRRRCFNWTTEPAGQRFRLNAETSPMTDERRAQRRNDSIRPLRPPLPDYRPRSDRAGRALRQMSRTIATERRPASRSQINGLVRACARRQSPADRQSARLGAASDPRIVLRRTTVLPRHRGTIFLRYHGFVAFTVLFIAASLQCHKYRGFSERYLSLDS